MSLRDFQPRYPYVLVQRLPRQQTTASGIILTDDSNKPLHEGVVLRTWAPWDRQYSRIVHMESEVKPGDHVLFPHYAGRVSDPEEPDVAFISEIPNSTEGSIYAVLSPESDETIREQVAHTVVGYTSTKVAHDALVDRLMSQFIIVRRLSRTSSGKSTDGVL